MHWAGAFAVHGGHGATASSTIVYEIEPGKRLGWHTDATEETQYIIAGQGQALYLEDGSTLAGRAGQRCSCRRRRCATTSKTPARKTLRAVAFFAAAMFTQDFDQVMLPPKSHYPRHAKPRGLTRRLCGLAVEELAQLVLRLSSLRVGRQLKDACRRG